MFNLIDQAWAMAPAGGQAPAGEAPSMTSTLLQFVPLILIFVVFYFLLIRPQQKKQQELKEMIDNLKKGDRVITNGGIYGEVESIKDNLVVLKIADKVKVDLLKSAIQAKV